MLLTSGLFASFEEKEEKIELSKVPEVVLKAAQEAVEGIEIKEAEIEKTESGIIYELEGTADGKTYEIEITPEGKVIEVEQEDGDDEKADKDDEEDDDEDDD
jgi:hypothetical protein